MVYENRNQKAKDSRWIEEDFTSNYIIFFTIIYICN